RAEIHLIQLRPTQALQVRDERCHPSVRRQTGRGGALSTLVVPAPSHRPVARIWLVVHKYVFYINIEYVDYISGFGSPFPQEASPPWTTTRRITRTPRPIRLIGPIPRRTLKPGRRPQRRRGRPRSALHRRPPRRRSSSSSSSGSPASAPPSCSPWSSPSNRSCRGCSTPRRPMLPGSSPRPCWPAGWLCRSPDDWPISTVA